VKTNDNKQIESLLKEPGPNWENKNLKNQFYTYRQKQGPSNLAFFYYNKYVLN